MTPDLVLNQRLHTQRLAGERFATPEAAVAWLGASQSQDFGNAKWSIGQRTAACRDAEVQAAFDAGRILRTHLLRPTWHFVTPDDIRWMLDLTAPHVQQLNGTMYRKLEMDDAERAKGRAAIEHALRDGAHLMRGELDDVLRAAGIVADKLRLGYFMMDAELEGLICSGAVRGKQQTYALLDLRAPAHPSFSRDEALARLAARFFTGHGPASLRDFVRWSGLTVADSTRGLDTASAELERVEIDGETLWFGDHAGYPVEAPHRAYLLPEYDECVLTYPRLNFPEKPGTSGTLADPFFRPVIVDRRRVGSWRRTVRAKSTLLEIDLFAELSAGESRAIEVEADRLGTFLAMPIELRYL